MAVESIVSFLIDKLNSLLVEEVNLLKGVSTEVRRIKDELRSMSAFLRDAESRADSEAGVKEWVAQVREVANNIEDFLDTCALCLVEPIHHGNGIKGFLHKTKHSIKNLKTRHLVAKNMQELRTKVIDISSRKAKYEFNRFEVGSSSTDAPSDRASHLRSNARFVDEADLVGIENPRNELIGLLVAGESRLTTISVVGMGGLGKTTLVGKVYGSERVKTHFEAFAWVTVSQTFSIQEIFRSMVKKFCGIKRAEEMGEDELIEELRSHLLQKRYVIVLDDLWKVDDWECIKIGLPNGECGSRIIVTTRINEVAVACVRTSEHVYNLPPLPFEQGWALFCKKAFQSDMGGNCPTDLRPLSEKVVRKCGGLPLAIAAIGGLLSTKTKTPIEWQKLYGRLGHLMESSSSLTIMNQILMLSYNDLPYHIKPCFMYVSIFPEDYLIRPMRLIQLWIAEGFVEFKDGMTLEEVADDCLHDLIDRSLIQVASYTNYGTIEVCRVHDVVREMILSKAREEEFMTYAYGTKQSDKTRRLVVHNGQKIAPKVSSHLRSFFMFGKNPDHGWFSRFKFLKVLDLEDTNITKFPSEIEKLLYLRFLSLRNTQIRTLPWSIAELKFLETLDLHGTYIEVIDTTIFKIKSLRHLLVCPRQEDYFDRMGGCRVEIRTYFRNQERTPSPPSPLLQQLGYIKLDEGEDIMIQRLGELTQLRWLGISELISEHGRHLCASIEKMTCLSSLSASSVNNGKRLLDLKYVSYPPPLLKHVDLRGCLEELPYWIPSLSNLVNLKLENSGLKEDPLRALQHLSNLMELNLDGAYDGRELCCEGGGFQRLDSLFLCRLHELKLVRVEKGAMPGLQKLGIRRCAKLKKVPLGIEHLTHLKELELDEATYALRKSIERDEGEDHWKISHVPLLKLPRIAYEVALA